MCCVFFVIINSWFIVHSVSQFEVHKGVEGSSDDTGSGDILSVVVPQELRGKSEVVILNLLEVSRKRTVVFVITCIVCWHCVHVL